MSRLHGAIAATRFGMGARAGEIEAASSDPRGWLKAQIRSNAAVIPANGLLSTKDVFEERQDAYQGMAPVPQDRKSAPEARKEAARQQLKREVRDGLQEEVQARLRHAATTPDSFAERWFRFWANHFTVAARSGQLVGLVGPFEREAIRPYVFASFGALLGHATFHPGMLVYLDAARSVGPSTKLQIDGRCRAE